MSFNFEAKQNRSVIGTSEKVKWAIAPVSGSYFKDKLLRIWKDRKMLR